jgi:hypothetical protein
MRSLRKTAGVSLIVVGLSGLGLTAMIAQDPSSTVADEEEDPLDPPSSSSDTLAMGLGFTVLSATGVWLFRASRRRPSRG